MKTIVSIIIPFFNAEKNIEACIKSIYKQELEEWEAVFIDDGSTDSSNVIVDAYAQNDARIKLLHQNNQGPGAARNYGINVAEGEYICFLDADDMLNEPKALKKMVLLANKWDCNICGSSYILDIWNASCTKRYLYNEIEIKEKIMSFMEYQNDYNFQSFIYRRDFIKLNGIVFPEYRRYQDPVFLLRAMVLVKKFCVAPVGLYSYRQSEVGVNTISRAEDIILAIRDNLNIALSNGYDRLSELLIERLIDWYAFPSKLGLLDSETEILLDDIYKIINATPSREILMRLYVKKFWETKKEVSFVKRMFSSEMELHDYLITHNIKNIILYGLGYYGEIINTILQRLHIEAVAYVDLKVKLFNGISAINDIKKVPNDGVIFVTNRTPNDSIKFLRDNNIKNDIITIYDIWGD